MKRITYGCVLFLVPILVYAASQIGTDGVRFSDGTLQTTASVGGPSYTFVNTNLDAGVVVTNGSVVAIGTNAPAAAPGGGSPIQNPALVGTPYTIGGWMTAYGSTTNNIAVPIYVSTTDADEDVPLLGFVSSQANVMQSRYAFQVLSIPTTATNWTTTTGLVFRVWQSSTSATNNLLAIRVSSPLRANFSTNVTVSAANTIQNVVILTNQLPAFAANSLTNQWTVRYDFQTWGDRTNAVGTVLGYFQ